MSLLSPVRFRQRLAEKLRNVNYRRRFFRLRAQEDIAQQIRSLREKRALRQVDFAKKAKMKQSAVSRIEQASYSAWTFKTLLRVADALDAQVKVIFEAAEDVIEDYARDLTEGPTLSKPDDRKWLAPAVDSNPVSSLGSTGLILAPIPSYPNMLGHQQGEVGALTILEQQQAWRRWSLDRAEYGDRSRSLQ